MHKHSNINFKRLGTHNCLYIATYPCTIIKQTKRKFLLPIKMKRKTQNKKQSFFFAFYIMKIMCILKDVFAEN